MDPNTNQNIPPQPVSNNNPPQQQQPGSPPLQGNVNSQIPNTPIQNSAPPQVITSTPSEDNAKSGTKTIVLIFIMLIIIGLLATFIAIYGRDLLKGSKSETSDNQNSNQTNTSSQFSSTETTEVFNIGKYFEDIEANNTEYTFNKSVGSFNWIEEEEVRSISGELISTDITFADYDLEKYCRDYLESYGFKLNGENAAGPDAGGSLTGLYKGNMICLISISQVDEIQGGQFSVGCGEI